MSLDLLLTADEIAALTGYRQAACQLAELKRHVGCQAVVNDLRDIRKVALERHCGFDE